MSIDNWKEGRWWTVLTSSFSHNNFVHFLFNMVTFQAFGTLLARIPGVKGRHLVSLCIGSALASSAAFLADQESKTSNREQSSWIWNSARVQQSMAGLGASGVVMGNIPDLDDVVGMTDEELRSFAIKSQKDLEVSRKDLDSIDKKLNALVKRNKKLAQQALAN